MVHSTFIDFNFYSFIFYSIFFHRSQSHHPSGAVQTGQRAHCQYGASRIGKSVHAVIFFLGWPKVYSMANDKKVREKYKLYQKLIKWEVTNLDFTTMIRYSYN